MNHLTELLRDAIEAYERAERPEGDFDARRERYQKSEEILIELCRSLDKAVPFDLIRKGEVVATVRTMGLVTSPGLLLRYSEQANARYCHEGYDLRGIDEVKRR